MTTRTTVVIEELLATSPFGMESAVKRRLYAHELSDLTLHHYHCCPEYRRLSSLLGYTPDAKMAVEEIPFIPVRLFKEYDLLSVGKQDIIKTMTSSGTSGQDVSRIYLDKTTAAYQTKALVKIVSSFIGNKRLPLLIVDSPSVIKSRALFSARGAGILGFSMLGHDATYMLDENYKIDFARLDAFLEKHRSSRILLFGFTFVIWEYLCQALRREGRKLEIDGILIHGGGWKQLTSIAVDNASFKKELRETCGIQERLQLLRNGRANRIDFHGVFPGSLACFSILRPNHSRSAHIFSSSCWPTRACATCIAVAVQLPWAFHSYRGHWRDTWRRRLSVRQEGAIFLYSWTSQERRNARLQRC